MNTTCCKTEFPRRRNNVIDFCAYRDRVLGRQAAAAGDELTFHWEVDESIWTGGTPRRRKPVPKATQPRPVRAKQGKKKSSERMDRLCLLSSLVIVSVVWLLILL